MDRYVSRDLQEMICSELEGIAKKKELDTPATVELLKELTSSLKNLMKIDKLKEEKEESMDRGYSQRSMGRYYVDGTYGGQREPWSYGDYSYAQGGRGMEQRYEPGNSYRYPRMYPIYTDGGYSRMGEDKEEMKMELRKLMESTPDEKTRKSILEIMNKLG